MTLGRVGEALTTIEEALAAPTARATELHRLAARLWLRDQDCGRALPHLRALAELDALEADAEWYGHCQGGKGR